jgi:tetratricopeptide (TPR) repeat protein
VELNPRNAEVYEILTKIYLEKKEYKKAREVCRYLMKLLVKGVGETAPEKHRLANCYSDLGWIYELENRPAQAAVNYQKAVDLEPNNPRFLDLLLKISIILKNKNLANRVFNSLRQADPDNQKLADIKEEIKNLPDSPVKV